MYGAPSYGLPPAAPYGAQGAPGFAGAPPHQPAYGGPPPQPHYGGPPPQTSSMGRGHVGSHDPIVVATNPDAFAAMYREQLAALTFNSKPIITNLTIIAHEHIHRMASVVAKTLDDHIMRSHPSIRLPALYLLDSICKNIGQPYTSLWAERIVTIFLETYRLVDQPTKMRMEELLATWKDSAPGARPLFGENTQWNIERPLFGSAGMPPPGHRPTPPPTQQQAGPNPSKARAIESIDRLLAIGAQELQVDPNNGGTRERMDSLSQLKQVLQTVELSPEEMVQVHAQLDSLSAASSSRHLPPPTPSQPAIVPPIVAPQAPRIGSPAPPQLAHVSNAPSAAAAAAAAPPTIPASIASALAGLGNLGGLLGGSSSATPPAVPVSLPTASATTAPAAQPDAASALIASLMQAGLLPGAGAAATAAAAPQPAIETDQDDEYVRSIMSLDIKVSGPDFAKEPPAIELLLHKHMPLQCRQCANRYPSGTKGQKGMDEHLDWHFTQNRRAKDSQVRGQSRSWFDKLESFIRGGFDDAAPSFKAGEEGSGSGGGKGGSMGAAQEKALKEKFAKMFVAAPTDAEVAAKPCPICKESFKSQWSEDEEEWIWLNAIEVDGVYYHASCHYSAKMLSESVSRRMSSPPGGGRQSTGLLTTKRSVTPSHPGQRSASVGNPIARIKGEEGVSVIPPAAAAIAGDAPSASPGSDGSRKRKASISGDEAELPSKKAA